jgi:hypothetical protein
VVSVAIVTPGDVVAHNMPPERLDKTPVLGVF